MIVTIDGPAGSGKSTVARELAKALDIACLDTGATYRAATCKALREGVDLSDEEALARVAERMDLRLAPSPEGVRVLLDGHDVSRAIRTEEVTRNAHYAARSPRVRDVLVKLQRKLGAELGSFVAEGRDQGSVVFPGADVKFYLDARPDVRARRRCDEMQAAGEKVSYESVLADINERDGRDKGRDVAPLVRPEGAVEIDTSDMTISEVVSALLNRVEAGR